MRDHLYLTANHDPRKDPRNRGTAQDPGSGAGDDGGGGDDPGPDPDVTQPPVEGAPPLYTTALAALRQGIGKAVSLLVRVTGIGAPEQSKDDPERSCRRLRLRDMANTGEIYTVPVVDDDLIEKAHSAQQGGARVIVTGRYVPHGKPRRGAGPPLHFQIDGFRDVTSPLDLLGASPADRAAAEQKIQELSKEPDGIFHHIKETLERCFQVVPSACSERHKDMQRFVMLQALSAGQVNAMTSDRLSCLVVSASGVGKKILVLYGKALSPVCAEVEPHNFTAAGLTTVQEQREGGERLCHPGALPESDGGAFFLSDAHRVPKGPLTATLRGSLMTVLEDGKVCPTKAARATYSARAAVHVNGNWQFGPDAVQVEGESRSLSNIPLLSEDMLSRFDVVVILDEDEDPAQMARDIAMQQIRPLSPEEKKQRERDLWALKVLVAQLIDRAPEVDMEPVKEQMGKLMDDITLVLRDATAKLTGPQRQRLDPDCMLKRCANSMRKIVGASARLDGRTVANGGDVKWAAHFINHKLEVVRWVCSDSGQLSRMHRMEVQVQRAEKARELRFKEILRVFGGREAVTLAELSQAVGCSAKLIQRELRQRGIEPAGKGYNIPTQAVWEAQQRLKELGKELGFEVKEEPEAKVEIDEDGQPIFEDKLRPLPERFEDTVRAMVEVTPVPCDQDVLAQRLVDSALNRPDYQLFEVIHARFYKEGYYDRWQVKGEDVNELLERAVREPDQVRRGVFALEVYMASLLPDISWYLEPALQELGEKVPAAVREAAEAVLARLRWYEWRDNRRRQGRV
jgi:DNA replicative helicase MCM subunit Mcm2 (Cdc46/Mcm family)